MGIPRAAHAKRQSCASGYQWYVCSNGPGFRGCCSSDPCTIGVCPAADQDTSSSSPSTAATAATATTTRASGRVAGTVDTSVARMSTATSMSMFATYPTVAVVSPTPTGAGETAGVATQTQTQTVTTAAGRSTITLNEGTATVTGAGAGGTGLSDSGSGGGGGSSVAPIAGGVVGAVVVLVLVLAAVVVVRRRRRRGAEEAAYGVVAEKQGFFSILFNGTHPPASPTSPATATAPFFGLFGKKHHHPAHPTSSGLSSSTDTKPTSPPAEMPAHAPGPRFYNHTNHHAHAVELESDVPSELSSASTPLYRSSVWTPSAVSTSSTGAVLSPKRETHYSDSSTAGGGEGSRVHGGSQGGLGAQELAESAYGGSGGGSGSGSGGGSQSQELAGAAYARGEHSQSSYGRQAQHTLGPHAHQQLHGHGTHPRQAPSSSSASQSQPQSQQLHDHGPQPRQAPSSSGASQPQSQQQQQGSGLRGGAWPGAGMMSGLSNSLRRKSGRAQQQQQQQQRGQETHVLSWMDYESEPGNVGQGGSGVIR